MMTVNQSRRHHRDMHFATANMREEQARMFASRHAQVRRSASEAYGKAKATTASPEPFKNSRPLVSSCFPDQQTSVCLTILASFRNGLAFGVVWISSLESNTVVLPYPLSTSSHGSVSAIDPHKTMPSPKEDSSGIRCTAELCDEEMGIKWHGSCCWTRSGSLRVLS